MNILYIGEPQTYSKYCEGIVPSHWLYGACEMEQDGHHVIWEEEKSSIFNDLKLILKYHPDVVFCPNLNLHNHRLLLLCAAIKLYIKPIYVYIHRTPSSSNKIKKTIYKFMFSGISHMFFLSHKTMMETIGQNIVSKDSCSVPGWGADINFYNKITTSDKGYFISTGKENRDFDILIEAFRQTGAQLIIMTAKEHARNNYEYLVKKCKNIPNISVVITENTGNVYPMMLKAMADAKALVCPIMMDKLNYCVGLSTISDAEGLRKPLIITRNEYHDYDRTSIFNVVESLEDWIEAIRNINNNECSFPKSRNEYSMKHAYCNMKKIMFK